MVAKNNTSKCEKPMTKAGFIRHIGPDVAPAEVIAKAKEQGLDLTKKLVWNTQSEMRTGGNAAPKAKRSIKAARSKPEQGAATASKAIAAHTVPAKRKKPGPKKGFRQAAAKAAATSAAPVKAANGATAEQKLTALVIELGTARAEEVYRAVKGRLNAIVAQA